MAELSYFGTANPKKMKKSYLILMHTLYWFYNFGWDDLIGHLFSKDGVFSWARMIHPMSVSQYLLFPLIFYINYFFILPRFFQRKQYRYTWIAWILLLISFIGLRYLIQEVLFLHWFGYTNYYKGTTFLYYVFDNIYFGGSLIVMSSLLWLVNGLITAEKEKTMLQEEKRLAEVSFLRNQINPHFIFNTMNNIYSLVYHRSEQALPAIEKLSGIMRYIMSDSDTDKTELSGEIKYLQNYIQLQSLRSADDAVVDFKMEGNPQGKYIAPLLLIPFVENGFKHGVINDVNHPLVIRIYIGDDSIELHCINKIKSGPKDHSSGIGLENVKRRLTLLYPYHHTLILDQTGADYTAKLKIKLS